VGDWFEVRSKEEILATLDSNGELDGMPFMPEMFPFCGKRFQVYKRAHKTCDTVFPIRGRRVDRAVHLNTRCDGSGHGGCQAGCLLFWKEVWLKPVAANQAARPIAHATSSGPGSAERTVLARASISNPDSDPIYSCQATRLPYATTGLKWWDTRQYVEDYTSGNVGLWRMICAAAYMLSYKISRTSFGLRGAIEWFYDRFHPLWRGTPFPRKPGTIPEGQPTPRETLNLQPGELVRVKPQAEILKTLDANNRNRGLYWDAEQVPYCGGTYRVLRTVTRLIDEKTGRMVEMKGPCVVLNSVVCQSRYSERRLFCPRSIYPYWRDIWLERVNDAGASECT
jgi:hypothetical protein